MDVFRPLKTLLQPSKVSIDNSIFSLHYRATFSLLVGCSAFVTARQYIGDPIDCIVEGVPSKVMDTFCWFSSTFTLPNRMLDVVGRDVAHVGLGNAAGRTEDLKFHQYYQWVCFVLAFQAILFYLPHYFWKTIENGRIELLSKNINVMVVDKTEKERQIDIVINYFRQNQGHHNDLIFRYVSCEALNFVNVIGQIYLMNAFLDGDFIYYGIDLLSQKGGISVMERVFPKMTKCTFHQYGPSGSIRIHDGLCVLAVNIINEKIYAVLWFWFLALTILTGLLLIYRVIVLTSAKVRFRLLCARARWSSAYDIENVLKDFKIGDWFVFYMLSKNIDPIIFKDVCRDLATKLNSKYDI